jgi:RNA polymerase sigma-70 factor (ECF subfamily)
MEGSGGAELRPTDESLWRLARRLTAREQDAEDLAQEVRLHALRRPGHAERLPWLRIVARRTSWRWSFREQARSQREKRVARPEALESDLSEVEAASLREYLEASVEALREPYREVVRLHYFEDLAVEEIAGRLGRPSVTVRVQISRGLDLLRERLEGRKGRFLGLAPLSSARSSPRGGWSAQRRPLALGAIAVVFAAAFVIVTAGRAERGSEALASVPGVDSRSGAPLAAPESDALAERVPVGAGALASAPGHPAALVSGRVLSFDGQPIAGAPVLLGDGRGRSRVATVSDGEGRYAIVAAGIDEWIEARPAGTLPTPPHLVCSVEEGRELDLVTARPSGVLRGRVWDAQERPVAGAEVELRSPLMTSRVGSLLATSVRDELAARASFGAQATVEGTLEPTRCRTDGSGRFEAPLPPEERILVVASAPGLPPGLELVETRAGTDRNTDGSVDQELEIRLAEPVSIAGRVLDRDGRPCAGARLELELAEPRPRLETRSDASGRYEFAGVGSGPFVLRLLERPSGTASCHVAGRIEAGQGLALDLELAEASTIAGTLVSEAGPLEGWTVVLWELADRDFPARDQRETRTASGGRFAFLGCSDKEYDLEYFDPEAPAEIHRVSGRAGGAPLTLRPRPRELVAFRGRIVRGEGAPRPSLLSIAPVRGSLVGRQTLVALDGDGFLGPSLPRGRVHVDAFFPGSSTPWRKTLELDGRELVLAVPGRGTLRIEVELPAGADFADASAFVRVRAPLATYWMHAPLPRDPGRDAFAAELMPGTYWVIVLLEGYAAEYVKARVEDGRETLLSVAPEQGTPVTLQVVAPRPLADGEVLRLEVEETDRKLPVPFFREAPGASGTWWAGVELGANARRIVSSTTGGLAGELALTPDLILPGAVLRIELEERGAAPR